MGTSTLRNVGARGSIQVWNKAANTFVDENISGFRRGAAEAFALLGCYAT